jgi:hypothetical protein
MLDTLVIGERNPAAGDVIPCGRIFFILFSFCLDRIIHHLKHHSNI